MLYFLIWSLAIQVNVVSLLAVIHFYLFFKKKKLLFQKHF